MNYLDSLFSLNGRGAIVSGAARGNGRALAEALARAGASVVLTDVLGDELERTVVEWKAEGLKVTAFAGDLTEEGKADALAAFAEEATDGVDVLVNNAGVTLPHEALSYPDESWRRTLDIDLGVPFRLSRAVAQRMKERGRGSIINITSLNSELGFADNPAYMAAKGGLKQLTKSLAYDFGRYGLRANNIGPGYFKTDMTKGSWGDPEKRKARSDRTLLGRWGDPSDLAGTVIFLASDASSYITGQDIYVDGGWMVKGM